MTPVSRNSEDQLPTTRDIEELRQSLLSGDMKFDVVKIEEVEEELEPEKSRLNKIED